MLGQGDRAQNHHLRINPSAREAIGELHRPVIESFKLLKEIYQVDDRTFQRQLGLFDR